MTEQETLYAIALSFVPRLNLLNRKMLIEKAGSATSSMSQSSTPVSISP